MIKKKELQELYFEKRLQVKEIAEKFNCTRQTVSNYLKKYELYSALPCNCCGKLFDKNSKNQIYCSQKCNEFTFRTNNPQKIKGYRIKTYIKNRDKILEKQNNSEEVKEYRKNYWINNKIKIKATIDKEKHNVRSYTDHHFRKQLLNKFKECYSCDSDNNLQIHHKNYDRTFKDCMVMCKPCHYNLHSKYGGD